MSDPEATVLAYVVVRALPDPIRGELLNVALIGSFANRLFVRTLPATRCMQAMLTPPQLRACESLSETISNPGRYGYPVLSSGLIAMEAEPSKAYLEYIHTEGLNGFVVDAVRSQCLREPSFQAASEAFSRLYLRLVAPQPKFLRESAPPRSRARTIVSRLLSKLDPDGFRIARDLRIRDQRTNTEFDIDFAYVNGKLTLGQTVDFQTAFDTYAPQVDHVIATIADLSKVAKANFLNVVQVGENSEDYSDRYERLRNWGTVIELPSEREVLEQMLAQNARHDIRTALTESGLHVERSSGNVMELTAITATSAQAAPELDF